MHTNALGGAGSPKLVIPDGCTLGTASGWDLDREVEIQAGGRVNTLQKPASTAEEGRFKNLRFKGTDAKPCWMHNLSSGGGRDVRGAIHLDGSVVIGGGNSITIYSDIEGASRVIFTNSTVWVTASNLGWSGDVVIRNGGTLVVSGRSQGGVSTGAMDVQKGGALLEYNAPGSVWTNVNSSLSGAGKVDLKLQYSSTRHSIVFKGTKLYPGGDGTVGTNLWLDARDVRLGAPAGPATLSVDLAGTSAGQYDTLRIDDGNNTAGEKLYLDGNVKLEMNLVNGFTPTGAESFTIVNNLDNATRTVVGRFSSDNGTGKLTFPSGYTADVTYTGGDGNDIVLSNLRPPPPQGVLVVVR
jgi:hypothetical protein